MQQFTRLWRRKPLVLTSFLVATTLAAIFGIRAYIHYDDAKFRLEKPVAGWMTPQFIAKHYHIQLDDIYKAISDYDDRQNNKPIGKTARDLGLSRTELLDRIEEVIDREHPDRRR